MRLIAKTTCASVFLLIPSFFTHATEHAQAPATEARTVGTHANWDGESTEDLHLNCPDFLEPLAERGVRGGFTAQCEAILDQRFGEEMVAWAPIYAKDRTLTWRYVFDEPLTKRRIVLDSLGDPDCTTSDNHPIGDELVEKCNANAIADFAALKYECSAGLPSIHRFIKDGFEVPDYLSVVERIFDNDSYWEKRWRLEYAFFRQAWIAAKCAGLPEKALDSLDVIENTMNLGGSPAPGEEDWWRVEQGFEAYQLMGIAARLSSNLARSEYGYERETLSSWQRIHPVMAELLKVKDPGEYPSAEEEKAARLKHYIAASTWIRMKQAKVNRDWLLRQVGEFSDEELAQAADEAATMMAKQGVGETWF